MASGDRREETLDPRDWDDIRDIGHRMIDDMVDYLSTVRRRGSLDDPAGQSRGDSGGQHQTTAAFVPISICSSRT